MKTIYSYAIKTDGEKTYLTDNLNRQKIPLAAIFADGEKEPRYAASLLRDLAKWAIEQAEIIEDMEGIRPVPKREPFAEYRAEIVRV